MSDEQGEQVLCLAEDTLRVSNGRLHGTYAANRSTPFSSKKEVDIDLRNFNYVKVQENEPLWFRIAAALILSVVTSGFALIVFALLMYYEYIPLLAPFLEVNTPNGKTMILLKRREVARAKEFVKAVMAAKKEANG